MTDERNNAIRLGFVCTSIGVFVTTTAKVIVAAGENYSALPFDILDNFSSLATILWFNALIIYFRTLRSGIPSY